MTEPVADVVAVSGRSATVSVDADVACARCAAGKGCGAAFLSGPGRKRRFEVDVPDEIEVVTGDRVSLILSPRHLLKASFAVYGWPLAALVIAPAAAEALWGPLSELALVGVAVSALVLAFLAGRRRLRQEACLQQFVPSIGALVARRAQGRDAGG